MLVDLTFKSLNTDHLPGLKGRDMKNFQSKYELLTKEELMNSLYSNEDELMRMVNQSVPCVGCRRNVDRLFQQFKRLESQTLDPIRITKEGGLSINETELKLDLCKMLQKSGILMERLQDRQQWTRKGSRCHIHSMDTYKDTPILGIWTELWNTMKPDCRKEMLIIEMHEVQSMLDVYLKKHKFCHECSNKVRLFR